MTRLVTRRVAITAWPAALTPLQHCATVTVSGPGANPPNRADME
ncbi:MAG: hypothetical protein K0S43_189 [Cellulosimicrobium sp.]|nr:hypothetical protein [Cellulosimicrobium sp.]